MEAALIDCLSTAACLARILDINEKRIRHMVGLLPSVLHIPSEKNAPIKPLHLSFRDFLINRDKHKTDQSWVVEKETQKLAIRCLQLLLDNGCLKRDICGRRTPGVARSDIDKKVINSCLPPEAQYACLYWVYHFKDSQERVRDGDQAHEFLELHFLHWLEALSLIGRISESIGFIDELQSIVDPEKGAQVVTFLRDAKRFVLNCCWIIDTAPLQLYASALVFAPKQSIMRQTFQRYLPRWISLLSNVDSNWNAVLQTLEGHTSWVRSMVFSKDGKLIASASPDKTAKIWNVATGEEERTLEGHMQSVSSVVFSKDGTLIASGSYDKTVKIWNVATGINVKSFDASRIANVFYFLENDSVFVTSAGRFSLGFLYSSTSYSSERELKLGSPEGQGEVDIRLGFGINHDNTWITAGGPDGRRVLWVPPDFRPGVSTILTEPSGSVHVIGCGSGRVVAGYPEEG